MGLFCGKPKPASRRGITLLFVVSMIVLFLLMGTTFVIVSNDYFRAAQKRRLRNTFTVDSEALVERAFYDVLRGPELSDSNSSLRTHSLLADMYGYGISGAVQTATPDSSEHFITLTLDSNLQNLIDGSPHLLEPVPGLMSGQVLSIVSGPHQGLSTRIIDHQVSGNASTGFTHRFVVLPSLSDRQFSISQDSAGLVNQRIIINGRPFSGTGSGHVAPGSSSRQTLTNSALAPNQTGVPLTQMTTGADGYLSLTNPGGTVTANSSAPNEAYDTFDFQNMFLAGIRPDGSLIPGEASFFNRELSELFGDGTQAQQQTDFRAFNSVPISRLSDENILTVDNNQDGQPDGMWMDIGLPVQCLADGRCVKPLASLLILDMDGRINLNAHGNLVRDGIGGGPGSGIGLSMSEIDLLGGEPLQGSRGQGFGPPEINLSSLLADGTAVMLSRYGADGRPGQAGVRDVWSNYKLQGYPDGSFRSLGLVDGLFSTAMDVHGRFVIGYPNLFDVADPTLPVGMPVASVQESTLDNEIVDSAYEMSFTGGPFFGPADPGFDNPFSYEDLESVMRRFDIDSLTMPNRLTSLGISGGVANSVTTHSFEVPTTVESLPNKLYQILRTPSSAGSSIGVPGSGTNREDLIRNQLQTMLPPEILRGLPMNVNREFGDGLDNNGNQIIDEVGERDVLPHPNGTEVVFDHDNGLQTGPLIASLAARTNFARHLYIVTLLSTERVDRNGDGFVNASDWYDFDGNGLINQNDLINFRRVVAQWSINVVDFRDPDSIMTPFEVDLNPWDGWDVDGSLGSEEDISQPGPGGTETDARQVFWGTERPELLITETLVTHDRRTQDTESERLPNGETPTQTIDTQMPDEDFDSQLVPKVSAFFELYNPWVLNDTNQVRAAEFYDPNGNGVDLQKTTPSGTPIWRLIVTDIDQTDLDPDDPTQNDNGATANVVREIYFTTPAPSQVSARAYFPEESIAVPPVEPGKFAVVGTAGNQIGESRFDTYFGRRTDSAMFDSRESLADQTRRISLDPVNQTLTVLEWDDGASSFVERTNTVVALPIGLNGIVPNGVFRDLGVSDPINGYLGLVGEGGIQVTISPVTDGLEDGLTFIERGTGPENPVPFVFDTPVDQMIDEDHYNRFLRDDGIKPGYRTVHLQRLANPTLPFNARSNPYRTIDSSSLDLFVYNGAETITDPFNNPQIIRFGTYERRGDEGSGSPNSQSTGRRLLFKNGRQGLQNATDNDEFSTEGLEPHIFSRNLEHTLGTLNQTYQPPPQDNPPPNGPTVPPVPYAALTWNNRPFASHLELANVPFTSSYWTTRLFNAAADSSRNVYQTPIETDAIREARNYTAHFPHLLNFYMDRPENGSLGLSLHQVFDFLEVPSRFVGTELFVNPATFENSSHGVSFGLAPPFDRISNYRYPGKININTVLDARVWNGLMGFYATASGSATTFANWVESRNGDAAAGSLSFSNPYRPARGHSLVPPMVGAVDPAECGLFRSRNGDGEEPFFDFNPATPVPFADPNRAAYFRYDMRQRLGNLVTSRSSVFAVWVTVGFFQSDPDGTLAIGNPITGQGVEHGLETGDSVRHRGFFLVDRSIPVAFEPGRNHNVDRAVVVRKIIE